MSNYCFIGPLNLHTYNHERTECIWCGPNRLASKPGRWVSNGDGTSAWSVEALGCVGDDPTCPCQDGDPCHYVAYDDSPAMPIPTKETA